jgi:UPF0755 protein
VLKRWLVIFFLLAVCAFALIGMGGYLSYVWLNQPLKQLHVPMEWEVKSGESLTSLAQRLGKAHVLKYPKLWSFYGRWYAPALIQVGDYKISAMDTPATLLNRFQKGDVIRYSVALIEGKTFKQWLNTLSTHPKLKVSSLSEVEFTTQLLESLNIEHAEGWFFPDTYSFRKGESDKQVLQRAHNAMRKALDVEWSARAPHLPYKNPYEALIMASIIEKETGLAQERTQIAGVFVRRLQKGMLLQTDPTVIYGLGEQFDGNLRRRDLKQWTPYNTYVISGLPPTPIAMPSLAALRAALHPEAGTSLYFVAKGDGSHHFSSSLEEHNSAVDQYQRKK